MQEKTWLERLEHHIQTHINPLLSTQDGGGSGCISHRDVVQTLTLGQRPHSHAPPHHLVELEVVTVKHLLAMISNSFSAASLSDIATSEDLSSDVDPEPLPPPTTAPLPRLHGELSKAPVMLLGVLMSSLSPLALQAPDIRPPTRSGSGNSGSGLVYAGLVLADATGKIPCEVKVGGAIVLITRIA